jgi:hypothetical protein
MNLVEFIFNACVVILDSTGRAIGLNYEEINVLVFIVLLPFFIGFLLLTIIRLRGKLKACMSQSMIDKATIDSLSK